MANPYFEMAEGAEAGKRLELPDGATEVVLGRAADCQIVIPSAAVSRRHARVRREPDRMVLEDLGSSNGTFVNGERVEGTIVLKDGDQVSFGSVSTTFVMPAPPAEAGATIALPGPGATVLISKTSVTATMARHETVARPAPPPPPSPPPPVAAPSSTGTAATRTGTPTMPTPTRSAPAGAAALPGMLELAAIALGSFLSIFGIGLAILFYLR